MNIYNMDTHVIMFVNVFKIQKCVIKRFFFQIPIGFHPPPHPPPPATRNGVRWRRSKMWNITFKKKRKNDIPRCALQFYYTIRRSRAKRVNICFMYHGPFSRTSHNFQERRLRNNLDTAKSNV